MLGLWLAFEIAFIAIVQVPACRQATGGCRRSDAGRSSRPRRMRSFGPWLVSEVGEDAIDWTGGPSWRPGRSRRSGLRRCYGSFVFALDRLVAFSCGFHGMQRIEKAEDALFEVSGQARIAFDFFFQVFAKAIECSDGFGS